MDYYDRLGNNVDLMNADEGDENIDDNVSLPEDSLGFSPYQEAMDDEYGAQFGDPAKCPYHPSEIISSPDGMFDSPCGYCENEYENDECPADEEISSGAEIAKDFVSDEDEIPF